MSDVIDLSKTNEENHDALEAWLEEQDNHKPSIAIAIASRSAMRVFPNVLQANIDDLTYTVIRAIFISLRGAKNTRDDITDAAFSAADSAADSAFSAALSAALSAARSAALSAFSAAFSVADSALSAADSAFSAADSALSAADVWRVIDRDIDFFIANNSVDALVDQPLWHDLDGWSDEESNAIKALKQQNQNYGFFVDWIFSVEAGGAQRDTIWDAREKIALIPNDDWEQGIDRVAELIAEIEAERIAKESTVAEIIDFDEAKQRFVKRPLPIPDALHYQTIIDRVADAVDDAVGHNRMTEDDYEVKIIRRTLAKYVDDAQRVEMDLMQAATSINRRVDNEAISDHAAILAFRDVCISAALDIRSAVPEIAEARAQRFAQQLREMDAGDRDAVQAAGVILAAATDDALANEMAEDFEAITIDPMTIIGGDYSGQVADPTARIGNRIWSMKERIEAMDADKAERALELSPETNQAVEKAAKTLRERFEDSEGRKWLKTLGDAAGDLDKIAKIGLRLATIPALVTLVIILLSV